MRLSFQLKLLQLFLLYLIITSCVVDSSASRRKRGVKSSRKKCALDQWTSGAASKTYPVTKVKSTPRCDEKTVSQHLITTTASFHDTTPARCDTSKHHEKKVSTRERWTPTRSATSPSETHSSPKRSRSKAPHKKCVFKTTTVAPATTATKRTPDTSTRCENKKTERSTSSKRTDHSTTSSDVRCETKKRDKTTSVPDSTTPVSTSTRCENKKSKTTTSRPPTETTPKTTTSVRCNDEKTKPKTERTERTPESTKPGEITRIHTSKLHKTSRNPKHKKCHLSTLPVTTTAPQKASSRDTSTRCSTKERSHTTPLPEVTHRPTSKDVRCEPSTGKHTSRDKSPAPTFKTVTRVDKPKTTIRERSRKPRTDHTKCKRHKSDSTTKHGNIRERYKKSLLKERRSKTKRNRT